MNANEYIAVEIVDGASSYGGYTLSLVKRETLSTRYYLVARKIEFDWDFGQIVPKEISIPASRLPVWGSKEFHSPPLVLVKRQDWETMLATLAN